MLMFVFLVGGIFVGVVFGLPLELWRLCALLRASRQECFKRL